MKSKWLALILAVLAAAAAAVLLFAPGDAAVAEIYLDGVLYRTVDLGRLTGPLEIPVGDGNVVRAEPGRVCMASADCPDQLCVRRGWSASAAKPIVCLPNGVTVLLRGGRADVDAVLA